MWVGPRCCYLHYAPNYGRADISEISYVKKRGVYVMIHEWIIHQKSTDVLKYITRKE